MGLSTPNPDTKDFSRKVLWNLKSFAKVKWCVRCEVLVSTFLRQKWALLVGAIHPKPRHKGLFEKSPLESQKLRQSKVVYLSEVLMPTFLRKKGALSVGAIHPKPRHKGLFGKSPLESQKLCQNKVVYLSEVLLPTFLRKKSRCYFFLLFLKSMNDTAANTAASPAHITADQPFKKKEAAISAITITIIISENIFISVYRYELCSARTFRFCDFFDYIVDSDIRIRKIY